MCELRPQNEVDTCWLVFINLKIIIGCSERNSGLVFSFVYFVCRALAVGAMCVELYSVGLMVTRVCMQNVWREIFAFVG